MDEQYVSALADLFSPQRCVGCDRRANVEGAYAIRGRVRGRVLLVEDVFTTGAAMSSCTETLLRGGAQEVHAVSLCRTK